VDMTKTAAVGMKKRSQNQAVIHLVPQISPRNVYADAFFANFLTYFTSDGEGVDLQNRQMWLHYLPNLATDGSNEALSLAVQATAFAYCGTEMRNPSLVQDAWKVYGRALSTHARLLKSDPKEVTVHMVSTSVLLSLFEAMSSTTADAYQEHISGAAKMIEITGPGQCFRGVMCQLFFHIRTQMAFVYLTTRKKPHISVQKILKETLGYKHLPTFQRLMTHVTTLAEIYVQKTSPGSTEQLIDLPIYSAEKAEIDALWLEFNEDASSRGEKLSWKNANGFVEYRDGFTALSVAHFDAARILFSNLAPRLHATYPDFVDPYASILSCSSFLRTHRVGCAYMRMATPLYLVALHSPNLAQRRAAISTFEDWKWGSMKGISSMALQRIGEMQDRDIPDGVSEEWEREKTRWETLASPTPLRMFSFDDWVGHM